MTNIDTSPPHHTLNTNLAIKKGIIRMTAAESENSMPQTANLVRALVKEPGRFPSVATLPAARLDMYEAWGTSADPEAFEILFVQTVNDLGDDVVVLSRSQAMLAPANLVWNDHVAHGPVAIVRRLPNGDFAEIAREDVGDVAAWMIEHAAGVELADLTYHGVSEGPGYDTVYVSRPSRKPERYALPHRELKSRIGFSWGYDGPSSFDLGVAIIHDALALDPVVSKSDKVMALYQAFTSRYVATFAATSWVLPGDMVMHWIKDRLRELLDVDETGLWVVPGDL